MPISRSELVDPDTPGLYHCVSRCVRRAHLCGGERGEYEHRRAWLEQRLRELTGLFAIDVVAFAVMANHLHVLLWTDPQRTRTWTPTEVARRWLTLHPASVPPGQSLATMVRMLSRDSERIEILRTRLGSLSWFNRCLKEPIARLANAEDGCTGAFWEGRFKSYRVADEAGALRCAVYIDLNPIRAGIARTPETSHFTSVRERAVVRRRWARRAKSSREPRGHRPRHAEDGLWLTPFGPPPAGHRGRRRRGARTARTLFGFGVETYLKLVDAAGRWLRAGKTGAIPHELRPILERLDENVEAWANTLTRGLRDLWGTTVGTGRALAREALRRGRRWVVDPLGGPG